MDTPPDAVTLGMQKLTDPLPTLVRALDSLGYSVVLTWADGQVAALACRNTKDAVPLSTILDFSKKADLGSVGSVITPV